MRFQSLFQKKAIVLMYHRIASDEIDPWELSVTAKNFEEHLELLKHFNVISINELTKQIKKGKIESNSVVITFDDGYINNFQVAKPLLEKYNIPATFFVTSKNIDKKDEFWWDELAYIIFKSKHLPDTIELEVKNKTIKFNLQGENVLTEELDKKHFDFSIYTSTPTLRAQLYYLLWEQLHQLRNNEQEIIMQIVRDWAGMKALSRDEFKCMSKEQIAQLSCNSLFTIGGHTTTHPALSFHDKSYQFVEIEENKKLLTEVTGSQICFFAYPSGKFNEGTIEVTKQLGFEASVTTDHRPIKNSANLQTLGRYQVNDWNGTIFKNNLKRWFKH